MTHRSILAALSLLAFAAGCSSAGSSPTVTTASSTHARATTPNVPDADAQALRTGNTAFAADLYRTIASDPQRAGENVFFSPSSISIALAMTYAGARGATATQMATALHYTLPQDRLHAAFDALDLALDGLNQTSAPEGRVPFQLHVANSVWGTPHTTFVPAYLDTLAVDYGAGVRLTDFASDPDGARGAINGWVDEQTDHRIHDLLAPGTIDTSTRLVLVNAMYFQAMWDAPFQPSETSPQPFHGAHGDTTVQMMHRADGIAYASGAGWQAVSLPYTGADVSFVAVLPDDLASFERGFTGEQAQQIADARKGRLVYLGLPRFEIPGASFSLKTALGALGVADAFEPAAADFSGMATDDKLFVSDVIHQAFVRVDETGTEAAAATAVDIAGGAAEEQPLPLVFDKPFVFFVRDERTGAILFLGRVVAP